MIHSPILHCDAKWKKTKHTADLSSKSPVKIYMTWYTPFEFDDALWKGSLFGGTWLGVIGFLVIS